MVRGVSKANVKVREDLLRHLDAPLGSVVILRRPTPSGDVIVVQMAASNVIAPGRRTAHFDGFPVDYEVIDRAKLGRW